MLIISHNCFSKTHNNGKTLSAIFSGYKPEELCQLYFTAIGKPDFERCMNYYFISDKNAMNSVFRRSHCGKQLFNEEYLESDAFFSSTKKKKRPGILKKYLRTAVWMLSAWYNGGLCKWIESQKPNVIFYVGGDGVFSHRIAVKLSKRLNLPLATYFTDDYIINPPSDCYNIYLKRVYKETISHSAKLFAIGRKMADEYTSYYHREFIPIMNVVDIPTKMVWRRRKSGDISINYFGGLHLGRSEEIIRFARFMRDHVKDKIKGTYSIGVYSFSKPSEKEYAEMKELGISFYQGITGDELTETMKNSDVLLHVESIRKEFSSLTKLSVSTKIPEYMCYTKPILAFGPADVASFCVIAEANPSLVVNDVQDSHKMDEQAKQLSGILCSDLILSKISDSNYNYAKMHFDKGIVSEQFKKEISSMIM